MTISFAVEFLASMSKASVCPAVFVTLVLGFTCVIFLCLIVVVIPVGFILLLCSIRLASCCYTLFTISESVAGKTVELAEN